jgi:hypothetical protein
MFGAKQQDPHECQRYQQATGSGAQFLWASANWARPVTGRAAGLSSPFGDANPREKPGMRTIVRTSRSMGTAGSRMLKLRTIGIRDYSVLEGGQRIGRIRFTEERMPGVWLWNINVHLKGF